jgi:hypothetical protein
LLRAIDATRIDLAGAPSVGLALGAARGHEAPAAHQGGFGVPDLLLAPLEHGDDTQAPARHGRSRLRRTRDHRHVGAGRRVVLQTARVEDRSVMRPRSRCSARCSSFARSGVRRVPLRRHHRMSDLATSMSRASGRSR